MKIFLKKNHRTDAKNFWKKVSDKFDGIKKRIWYVETCNETSDFQKTLQIMCLMNKILSKKVLINF